VIRLTIHDDPIGKGRPRLVSVGGHARAFTPSRTRKWEARAAQTVIDSLPDDHDPTEPARLQVVAVFRRPGSMECSHKRRPCRCDRDGLRVRLVHRKRPDADNVLKAVCDALEKGGALKDDSQLCRITVEKWYAAEGEAPSIVVELRG
jgi:Holliday junction resolvase RusA-like endonuclease